MSLSVGCFFSAVGKETFKIILVLLCMHTDYKAKPAPSFWMGEGVEWWWPLLLRTNFLWVLANAVATATGHLPLLVFSVSILSPLLHHSACLCSKRQKCSDKWKNTKKYKLLFFSCVVQLLSAFSLWQRLSLFTEYEVLSGQTAFLAALKA